LGSLLAGLLPGSVLSVDQAFRPSLERAPDGLRARFEIASGHYLYRERLSLRLEPEPPGSGPLRLPAGEPKDDPAFGQVFVFHDTVTLEWPAALAESATGTVVLGYQGCSEKGLCYPPEERRFDLASLPLSPQPLGRETVAVPVVEVATVPAPAAPQQDQIAARLATGNPVLVVLAFFGFGLLLAFTPCVFPMLPILAGIIAGQAGGQHGPLTVRRGFVLSLVYVLAMASAYAVAGVLAGLFGANIQAMLQNPWVLSAFAALFVALALSMFGLYELQLPASWQGAISGFSAKQRGGSLVGVAIMGLLSALIVGPCVAPPLAGALIYIGQSGDALLGGTALFALGLGTGVPLLALGAFGGRVLPRAGAWMNTIKAVFGVLMLGLAIWLLGRILPGPLTLSLWGLLALGAAVWLGPFDRRVGSARQQCELTQQCRLRQWLGIALGVYGIAALWGALGGNDQPLRPLASQGAVTGMASAAGGTAALNWQPLKGETGLEAALAEARAAGRPLLLDFYADWCVACKELEHNTFSHAEVAPRLAALTLYQADVTANDAEDRALMRRLGIIGPPAVLLFDARGEEVTAFRVVGYLPPAEFLARLDAVGH